MKGNGSSQLRIKRLPERSVVCQAINCDNPAEFTVRDAADVVTALCREHLKGLGINDKDIPGE